LGTSLTERQAKKIKGYTDDVVITYDNDGAGQKAALRAIPILKNVGLTVRVLNMAPYKDPDEFILNLGADEYRKRIEKAINGFDFEANVLEASHDMEDPDSKTQFDHKLAETIARIDDPFARNNHIKAAARKYEIEENELRRQVNEIGLRLKIHEENEAEKEKQKKYREVKPEVARAKAEYTLLNIIVSNKERYELVKDVLKPEDFPEGTERKIYEYIVKDYERTGQTVGARIVEKFDDADERRMVADILMTSGDFDDTSEDERRKAFADFVYGLKKSGLEREIGEAIMKKDNDRLKSLLEEENGLENLRKKLMIY
jgi:DNA primase